MASRVGPRIDLFEACSAFTRVTACTLALSPIRDTHNRWLQLLYYVHSCSGCFRMEHLPGGVFTHWENAAFSRRTSEAIYRNSKPAAAKPTFSSSEVPSNLKWYRSGGDCFNNADTGVRRYDAAEFESGLFEEHAIFMLCALLTRSCGKHRHIKHLAWMEDVSFR
jgi:hypothetical protein